jgi:hypothetical protein
MANRPYVPKLMQLNTWVIIAAALLVLLVIARYMQHQEPPAICTDRPTAPEWVGRWLKVCFTQQTACVRMVRTGPLSTQKNPSYLRAVD